MKDFAELISAVASFLWPCVFAYGIYRLGSLLKDFFTETYEGSLKGFGIEASVKRRVAESLVEAETKILPEPEKQRSSAIRHQVSSGKSARLANLVVEALPVRQLQGKSVLWIDDHPEWNIAEWNAMKELGLKVISVKSSEEAIHKMLGEKPDVIVSDVRRGEDGNAGFEFLDLLKMAGMDIPVVFYTGENTLATEAEALSKGAVGSTDSAADLIILVADALRLSGKADFGLDYKRRYRELRELFASKISG